MSVSGQYGRLPLVKSVIGAVAGIFAFYATAKAGDVVTQDVEPGKTLTIYGPLTLKGSVKDGAKVFAPGDDLVIVGPIGQKAELSGLSITLIKSGLTEADIKSMGPGVTVTQTDDVITIKPAMPGVEKRILGGQHIAVEPLIKVIVNKTPPAAIAQSKLSGPQKTGP